MNGKPDFETLRAKRLSIRVRDTHLIYSKQTLP